MSSSAILDEATAFAEERPFGILMTLENSVSGRPIGKYSAFPAEQEVLFPIGSRFRLVTSRTENHLLFLTFRELK